MTPQKKKKKRKYRKNKKAVKSKPANSQNVPTKKYERIVPESADPLISANSPAVESVLNKKKEHKTENIELALNFLKKSQIDTTPLIESLLNGKKESEIRDKSVLRGINTLKTIGDSSSSFMKAMESAFKNPLVNSQITDAYINSVTGAGTSIDKQTYNRYVNRPFLDVDQMSAMYTNSWVCRKIVDIPIDDALSEGISFTHLSSEDNEKIKDRLANLHFFSAMKQLGCLGSMSGCGIALIGVKDGVRADKLSQRLGRIEKNSLTGLTVVDRSYISPIVCGAASPINKNFLAPSSYIVWGANIHNSRVLRFDGDYLPPIKFQENGYFCASVFERIYDLLGRYDSIENAVSLMPSEMLLKIFKAADLGAWMGGNDSAGRTGLEGKIEEVIQVITTLQSVYRTVLLPSDAEAGFERQDLNVSGISEILMNYASLVAGAADIPHTRFLGESPAGMSSTGDGQFMDYNKKIVAIQENKFRPIYTYYFNIVAQDIWGEEYVDKNLSFQFNSIYSESEEAKVQRQTAEFSMVRDAVDAGFLTPAQALSELKAREIFPVITDKYIEWVDMIDRVEEAKSSGVWPEYGMFDDSDPGTKYLPPRQSDDEDKETPQSLSRFIQTRVTVI